MKTLICILTQLVALLTTASALQFGDFTYTLNAPDTNVASVTITDYTGSGGAEKIPVTINGLSVTGIESDAFRNIVNLTSVVIPDSVTVIGSDVFSGCTSLTNVTIGNSVNSVGYRAFINCTSLSSVTIPDSITTIEYSMFAGCTSLTNVTIPDSVTSIGALAFEFCTNLTSVAIPDRVTSINDWSFRFCTSLTSVTIPDSVTLIGSWAFQNCFSLTGVYCQGNAPDLHYGEFSGANLAIVYYMEGTTGWGATFGHRPTVLWNPLIQTDDGVFGVQTDGFGFNISESASGLVVVKRSSNLDSGIWKPIQTNSMSGAVVNFIDPEWTNHPSNFYHLTMP